MPVLVTRLAVELGQQVAHAFSQQMIGGIRARKPDVPARATEIVNEVTTAYIGKTLDSPELMDAFVGLRSIKRRPAGGS